MFISFADTWSAYVTGGPALYLDSAATTSSIHEISFVSLITAEFSVSVTKFASSIPSPASARANLVASKEYFFMASSRVRKFPVD